MKILITGASGLLGREIIKEFCTEHEVEGWALNRAAGDLKKVNLLYENEVEKAFKDFMPDVLIHSAAQRKPDMMEKYKEDSLKININATAQLAGLAKSSGIPMLLLSTDYIFNGNSPPYKEDDTTSPLNLYGQSKVEAEKVMLDTHPDSIALRVPILYGPTDDLSESAVTLILVKILEHIKNIPSPDKKLKIDDKAIRYPTFTPDVAKAIKFLIEKKEKGIFHYTGTEPYTKYKMGLEMVKITGLDKESIEPDYSSDPGAKRPFDSHLDDSKLKNLGFQTYTPFRKGMEQVLKHFDIKTN